MPNWKKVIVSGSQAHLAAVTASSQITVNPVAASTEAALVLGPGPAGGSGEGGQIALQPASGFTSGSFIDMYQTGAEPYWRVLRGTAANSDALLMQLNTHTKQLFLPAYTANNSFTGTVAGLLAFNSNGAIITTSASSAGGSTFPYTGTAGVTGSISATGPIYSQANGTMYFRGGDDAEFWDINLANHVGIYGQQDATIASIKLGSGGGIISGKSSNIGIGTTNPTSASLTVDTNVWARSFTGSLSGNVAGTASWATNVVGGIGVTSVATAGTVSGITLTGGTITSTGTITLGGSISGLTNSNLSGTAGITNANLANSSITIAGTSVSLGGSIAQSTILAGSGVFSGSAQIPNGSIANAQLANSSVTIGSTAISLGGSSTTLAGLTSVTSTNLTGSLLGNVVGTASWANNATNATNATNANGANNATYADNVSITNTTTGTGPYYPLFVDTTAGFALPRIDNSGLSYNATTNVLSTTASFATSASFAATASNIANAITGNTDNRILTATGGSTINGEASLTFDGTTLITTGSLLVSGSAVSYIYGGYDLYGGGNLNDSNLLVSINASDRVLVDINGAIPVVDWRNQWLNDAGIGIISLDWNVRELYDSSGTSAAAWDGRRLLDGSGFQAINWGSRYLFDSAEVQSINFTDRKIYDTGGNVSVDYGNWQLSDGSQIAADWSGRTLYDGVASSSLDWAVRRLYNAAGTTIVNWSGTTGTFNGTLNGTASWASNVVGGIGVTSVGTTGNVSGITLTGGTITSTGTITLGGSISGLTTSNLSGTAGITNAQLANSSVTIGSTAISLGSSATTIAGLASLTSTNLTGSHLGNTVGTASWATNATTAGSVTNAVTFNNGGAGDASGTTYNGSAARTISYNTVGAPSTGGTGATGTWGINISGNATTATTAASASSILASTVTGIVPVPFMSQKTPGVASYLGGDTVLTYNTSTGALNATTFNGALSGNATTATTATSASTRLVTTNADHYLVFVDANNVSPAAELLGTVAGLAFNPGTSLLSVPRIGSLTQISGSVVLSGSLETTGSFRGSVTALSIASNTASVNLALGNMFTLTLVNNTLTHIAFTNVRPGQTANIRITQGSGGNGTVSFQSIAKQPTGSAYTGSQVANAIDIVSLVTFDSTDVYVNSVRRLI